MNKLLSIIIPVYRVEQYIDKCLSSLIVPEEQMELLDVVVVNDGTPDMSAEMARVYEKKYPGVFRVINQENRGHGGAWNHGTQLAVGKYLFYLDSDDWFETSEFSKLIEFLKTCDTDMVLFDCMHYYAATDTYKAITRHTEFAIGKIVDVDLFDWASTGHSYDMTYAHDTVFRTAMMQKYLPIFCEHVMYDDIALQVVPIALASTLVRIDVNIYRYYIGRPGQSFDPNIRAKRQADDVSKVLENIFDWYHRYKSIIPQGGTRAIYTEATYQSLGVFHYTELSRFPKSIAKPKLEAWDRLLLEKYPDITPNKTVQMYRTLPWSLYMLWFRCRLFRYRIQSCAKRICLI